MISSRSSVLVQKIHLSENPAPPQRRRVILRVLQDRVEDEERAGRDDVVRGVVSVRPGVDADGVVVRSFPGLG